MAKVQSKKTLLLGGVAALVVLGAGAWYFIPNRSAPASPQAPAQALATEAGKEPESEAPEGVVELSEAQAKAAGIEIVAVGTGGGGEIRLAGRVEPMVDARAAVSAAVSGRVERVLVAPGQSVRLGQALAVMVSGEAASMRAEVDAAQAAAIAAERAHKRDEDLANMGVVAQREAEVSHAQALSAEATARAARARAAAAGSPNASGRFNVTSPIAGVITSVQIGPGGFVPQGGLVAEVSDPSRLEVVLNAPPAMAANVRAGSRLRVSGPNGEVDAVVTGVAAGADRQSGATLIRARASDGGLPPVGSAVTGTLLTEAQGTGVTVPSEAIQTVDGASVVFVRTRDGFKATPVLAGRQAAGRTEILRGLSGTERIASTNAFLLKAELAKGEAEHGH